MSSTGDALNRYLSTVRRIEEHREQSAVKELKKLYRQLMKEISERVAESYARYADPETGAIDYAVLHRDGMDARLLEEIMRSTGIASLEESRIIEQLAKESYAKCYDGMVSAVQRAATDDALQESLQTIRAVAPEVIAEAVHNPVNGLTLADRLEKKRGEIIYGIKQSVGVGLSQGDRYDTMTRRIAETLAGADGAGGYYGKAVRIARTEAHRVREAGNNDAAAALQEKAAPAGYQMLKRWNTMKDERVRPNRRYKTKHGWKSGKPGFYNHVAMDGVEIPLDEDFKLPSGASGPAPGKMGVAGEDINCRCFLTYRMEKRRGLRFKMNLQLHGEVALKKQSTAALRKGIRTFQKRIAEHEDKLRHPERYDSDWPTYIESHQRGLLAHWKKEIDNFKESIENRITELKERGEYEGTDK